MTNPSPRILVIGKNSYLAREFIACSPGLSIIAIGHEDVERDSFYAGVSCVVNFAFSPGLHEAGYDASLDVDSVAARRSLRHGAHFVMISSRRVYSEDVQWNATEDAEARGRDAYGRNKARIERGLKECLGDRLTVLRPGSVVGFEAIPGRQRIAAYMQNQLLNEDCIRLTVAARTRRDLVPIGYFCRVLRHAAQARIPGVFNVGAGVATSVGEAARWLIEGFRSGRLIEESAVAADEFQLDATRLARAFGLTCGPDELREALRQSGARLAQHRSR